MLMRVDIEECEQLNPCSHTCVNTLGSFRCACPSGMSLSSDGRVCKGSSSSLHLLQRSLLVTVYHASDTASYRN